jgi:hypothetical protein
MKRRPYPAGLTDAGEVRVLALCHHLSDQRFIYVVSGHSRHRFHRPQRSLTRTTKVVQ